MEFCEFYNIEDKEWNELFQKSRFSSIFQSKEFYQFINGIKGYSAEAFAVKKGGNILALMVAVIQKEKGIKSFFSRRAIVYGGPLLLSDRETEALSLLLKKASEILRSEAIYIETRNFFSYHNYQTLFEAHRWKFIPYMDYNIHTSEKDVNDVLSSMKYNRRREIKTSISNGASIGFTTAEKDVQAIYEILTETYRERAKVPLPDYIFFKSFLNFKYAKVFVVKYENKVIAGSFCLFYPGKGLYTMYYCGLREIKNNIFPTSLAVYASIEFAVKNGIPLIDLMGAGRPEEKYGVRDFKSKFGGELVQYGRFLKVLNPLLYFLGREGLKALKKISR